MIMGLLGDIFDKASEVIQDVVEDAAEIVTKAPGEVVKTGEKMIDGACKGIDKAAKKIFDE